MLHGHTGCKEIPSGFLAYFRMEFSRIVSDVAAAELADRFSGFFLDQTSSALLAPDRHFLSKLLLLVSPLPGQKPVRQIHAAEPRLGFFARSLH